MDGWAYVHCENQTSAGTDSTAAWVRLRFIGGCPGKPSMIDPWWVGFWLLLYQLYGESSRVHSVLLHIWSHHSGCLLRAYPWQWTGSVAVVGTAGYLKNSMT